MTKFLKSNKIISIFILFICFVFIINPQVYAKSCLNAISVWAIKVLPVLLPFFIFSRLIVNLSNNSQNCLDKYFCKFYNSPNGSLKIYLLSLLSGYPMGAKLICNAFENKQITQKQAESMFAFCSVSGPTFIIGTVGVAIFSSYKIGVIILISNILASLINGFIFKNKTKNSSFISKTTPTFDLQNSVYDALISILMVGVYIMLAFLLIDMLKNLGVLNFLSNMICCVFQINNHQNVVQSMICGCFEITRGAIELANCSIPLTVKTILLSGLIGFGGISVILQSLSFLSKVKIKTHIIFKQKFVQGILSLIISIPLSVLFV